MPPSDHLARAKAILSQPADDIGDHELVEAHAHATAACAEQLADIARLLAGGDLHIVTHAGPRP